MKERSGGISMVKAPSCQQISQAYENSRFLWRFIRD
jgi:hypothetical protein